ncbi:hypothetical protein F4679DRAFT_537087 [Xylaria curta]|nr:hypothetical protein F4679DRAFT_537087 [Xylaria curta]
MDEYLNREFDQDAEQNLRSSIELPGKDPHSPAPNFDAPGSHFIENTFPGPGKPTLTTTPTDPWALPPSVDKASPVVTDTNAHYEMASYHSSPELHPTNSVMTDVASRSNLEPQSSLLAIQTPVSGWDLAQSTDSEVSSTTSGEQAEQLPQQEPHQYSSAHYQFPVNSPQGQVSVFAAATMDQATQTQTQTQTPLPATATTAGPTPAPSVSASIPPEQSAPSVHSIAALPSSQQQPLPPPPIIPSDPRLHRRLHQYYGHLAYAMTQSYAMPPYFYCNPGVSPGVGFRYSNWNRQSPWYSGTSHHLTGPRPQVYTVEPAFIMSQQAAYYQPAPQNAHPYYYCTPGAPTYYRT